MAKKAAKKKTTGKKKASGKTKTSRRDIINLILRDHKPLWKLLKVMKSEKASLAEKKTAFKEFAPTLEAHAKPEENTWYIDMKSEEEMKQDGLEGDVEHTLAEQLCNELKSTSYDDLFEAKVKVLAEFVEHHLEEEEMLPEFKKNSTLEEREELGDKYEELRKEYV